MSEIHTTPTLIQTKLNRPALPVDLVPRPRLIAWLEQRRSRPLTLVSAPAGYGKSTLISCWLETVDCPTAWVSLDEHDNKLWSFLRYFLAATDAIFPRAVQDTQSFLMAIHQISIDTVVQTLINELNQIEEPFILVLDDYHLIETQTIHDLLNNLLLYPPANLHLVLGTRMDPILPLATLRANNQMTEVRIPDLRFNQKETLLLFQTILGTSVDPTMVSEIDVKAEGWVTGLRLAALAMQNRIGRNSIPEKLSINNRYVAEYLVSEILANQAATMLDCMLKISILERFCEDLCEVVCTLRKEPSDNDSLQLSFRGAQFMEWLQASNMFVIPLDDRHEWYRYHHLFREFLQRDLVRRFGQEEIKQLHTLAGHWYAQKGWVDEALYHFMEANEISAAIDLVAQHRYRMMNEAHWPMLANWIDLFQDNIIETSPELWMLKTWLTYQSGRKNELPVLLQKLDTILVLEQNQGEIDRLNGEIHVLNSMILFHTGDIEATVSETRKALKQIPSELWTVRLLARLYLGVGLLMFGDETGSMRAIYDAFEEEKIQGERFKANLLMSVSYIHWISADLVRMQQAAEQSLALCLELNHQQILGHSQYNLGCVHYQQDDLLAAGELFGAVVTRPYQNFGGCYANSVCGLSMTYQAQGKDIEARQVVGEAIGFLMKSGNTTQLAQIQALRAEIALRQGNLPAASQWAEKLRPDLPMIPLYLFLEPHFTLAKVWLAQKTPESLVKASELLSRLQKYLSDTHNTRFLIETLAVQALLLDALNDQAAALKVLKKSLRLAQPGGFIRIFVDMGSQMAVLFSQMKVDRRLQGYVAQIRSAFLKSKRTALSISRENLLDPLTNRELQVLELLRKHLTNKEIAVHLVISPGTVKGHTIRIYKKLNVNGRQQAVEKAISLGILIS